MKLIVINSNSAGNAYILENQDEALLIECGVNFNRIKHAVDFNLSKITGCIVTHEHNDHSAAAREVISAGINLFATEGTLRALDIVNHHRCITTFSGDVFKIGGFKIKAFDIQHDVSEPVGFLINHPETGNVLFLTDSYYCKYTFPGLNNIIIEANYSQDILDGRLKAGTNPQFLRDRVLTSHMSIDTCEKMLLANDLSAVNNIVLIHLSDSNSNEKKFKDQITRATGKQVYIASPGLIIDNFNKTPF
jgi:phosphoribosyl 1,2-cyclic phosphodiesterase